MKKFLFIMAALSISALQNAYASSVFEEYCYNYNSSVSMKQGVPEFEGYYYVKTISIYYDDRGRKISYNAWLYKSRRGNDYGVATDAYGLRRLETFLYQDWMPSWVRQYKYQVANTAGYCNI